MVVRIRIGKRRVKILDHDVPALGQHTIRFRDDREQVLPIAEV